MLSQETIIQNSEQHTVTALFSCVNLLGFFIPQVFQKRKKVEMFPNRSM